MSNYLELSNKKSTARHLIEMKKNKEKISMITAYDYSMSKIIDTSGIDAILVGDSASNVMAGNKTTIPITVEQMIYHGQCVVRGATRALVIIDMPFGSYHGSQDKAVETALKMIKETQADALKLEGGAEIIDVVKRIINAGIPVVGHLGLMPQSINKYGSYGVRAKDEEERKKLIDDAHLLEDAGCFAIVLEKIPSDLAKLVAEELSIPIIGIGAGADVDGQILVLQDMLGITEDFKPKFLRQYAKLNETISSAMKSYISDVRSGDFPSKEESY